METTSMSRRSREEILADVARREKMIVAAVRGEDVSCLVCGLQVKYYGRGSGRHPGVYCPTGCTEILMTLAPSTDSPKKE